MTAGSFAALLALALAACAREPGVREPSAPAGAAAVPAIADPAAFERATREARERFRAKDHRGAIAAYERALAANPGDPQVMYFLAVASARAGDADAALTWLGRLADAGADFVPAPDDFSALVDRDAFRTVADRLAAHAARHRRGTEAFRIPERGLLAEGIAYDPVGRAFYVGSATRRKIVRITDSGATADLAGPHPDLEAIGGLRVDAPRRRLWAVSGTDPRMDGYVATDPERNALVEIDLATGAIARVHSLTEPGEHGLNDVAVDAQGRPYATDTATGQLYTLAPDGGALAPVFAAPPFFRPNGIAFDDRGALYVADATGIYRVDLAARTAVRLAQPRGSALGMLDGLSFVRTAAGPRLVGIQSLAGPGRVIAAALSADGSAVERVETLEAAHPLFDAPTTGAVAGDAIYVIANSQLWFPREPRETIVLRIPLAR